MYKRQRYGRIVNLSSVVGLRGNAGQVNYAASKAGVIGMTKSLARELASRGVTVNAVAPGFIETDMTAAMPDAAKAATLASIPMGRLGAAEDVARTAAFLSSEEAALSLIHIYSPGRPGLLRAAAQSKAHRRGPRPMPDPGAPGSHGRGRRSGGTGCRL